jgi:hypothetical protein
MQINASKRLSELAVAEVPLDVGKNKYAKKFCVMLRPGR